MLSLQGVNNMELRCVNFFAQKYELGVKMIEFWDGVFLDLDARRHTACFIR
jgi:hypothetical protein